jgi:superfamily II DNA or RNA helicase|tara:strand:- start:7208 stop:8500 length:1293 start_codon:yes stop_codon:yes gene_type:complete
MKTLFPKQQDTHDTIVESIRAGNSALDTSDTGTGKTVVACQSAKTLGIPVAVICPKIVIPHWERELAETGLTPVFVTNYEKIRRGNKFLTKTGKKTFRWTLPEPGTLIIFDEVHRASSPWTQNAQMLIAAKTQGIPVLMLSATACQDPTEMRGIGYALGLHALNKSTPTMPGWFSWMKKLGCRQDHWKKWIPGAAWRLAPLHREMYSSNCVKITVADLPTAFTENHIITEPLAFAALKDIAAFYKEAGVTPEIITQMLDEDRKPSPHVVVEILRARQLVEAAKVPDIVDMVSDGMASGHSLVVFVNFTATVRALQTLLPGCGIIVGGQSAADREQVITDFQTDRCRVVVANAAAGGVGVSLHDVNGTFPRMSLISPSFDIKEYVQMLGRIHRNGAKSPALQRVLVASGTVEEYVMKTLERKRQSLNVLHG